MFDCTSLMIKKNVILKKIVLSKSLTIIYKSNGVGIKHNKKYYLIHKMTRINNN